jgi:hypothetical protein
MKHVVVMLLSLILFCGFAEARRHRNSKPYFVAFPPSRASLLMQNQAIDQMCVERIKDERELKRMVDAGDLQALPNNEAIRIAPSLPRNRRYVLPITRSFLLALAQQYYAEFHLPLQVDSAVRDKVTQKKLRKHNASAAPVDGETASAHETGATIDLSRKMTKAQTQWLEQRLLPYVYLGYIIVEEERHCFHIVVTDEAALLEVR